MKKRKFLQNKLWRDKFPEKLEALGSIIHSRQLNVEEYDQQLRSKLLEEIREVCAAQSQKELIEELADVFEVIDSLCALHNINKNDIVTAQEKKRAERGGFSSKRLITIAEHPENSYSVKYCLAQPEKYPEIKE